jgi:hypothetical protein
MTMIDVSTLTGVATAPLAVPVPRAVSSSATQQFRDSMSAADCSKADAACAAQPSTAAKLHEVMDMDIEKVLAAHMPSANASPAEFAVGMLRAQVKISQAAIAIEMVSKTTQSLSQGVQSLTTKS